MTLKQEGNTITLRSSGGAALGTIKWSEPRNQYCLYTEVQVVLDLTDLMDIVVLCHRKTTERINREYQL